MFVHDLWYVAGFTAEVAAGKCLARRFLGEPVVLYRTTSGILSALMDRCSHRAMPLSEGQVDGEIIRCPYHGLEFGPNGACVRIPGQDRIPAAAALRSYPVCERDELIWIWMGDPDKAEPSTIQSITEHRDPAWSWRPCYMHVKCNWQLLVDNLLDLTHVAYIHAKTIGGHPEAHFSAGVTVDFDGWQLTLLRKMPNSVPPMTYVAAGGFKGNVDRWQQVDYKPGGGHVLRVNAGACDVGTGAYEGRRENGFVSVVIHGVTPETETSTHYIWTVCSNASRGSGVPEVLFGQIHETVCEDQRVLEAQQRRIDDSPGMGFLGIASDGAVNRGRVLVANMIKRETAVES